MWIGLALVVVLTVLALRVPLRRLEVRRAEEARARFARRGVVRLASRATSFGVASPGASRLRGTGVLLAARDALFFETWVPRRPLEIPARSILRVEQVRSHRGRTASHPLVKVTFRRDAVDGVEAMDSVAFRVDDPAGWARTVEALTL